MKKVLLSSVAALAVFAAAAPVLAEGGVNGGANNPRGPQDTDVASKYYDQSEFVSARTVEEYLNGHMDEIKAEAAADPAVVAAKAEFDAVEGGSHLYGEKKAAYEAAFNTAFLNVRNKYVQQFQTVQNTAKKKEGRYYIFDMIGLEVQDTKGNVLGILTDVLQPGANDVYLVSKEGEPDQLFAAIDDVIIDIDMDKRMMIVDPPEGV